VENQERPSPSAEPGVNRTLHWVLWSALALVIAGLLIGFVRQQWRGAGRRDAGHLPRYRQVPAFVLTAQAGKPFDSSSLKGKIWLADFFFTACPGPCLTMNSRLQEVQESLRKADKEVRMVSFTINPEDDTPEVLRRYAERFHAATGQWFFLTGERAKIYNVARNGFMLAVQEDSAEAHAAANAKPPEPPQFTHSTKIALVDREGAVRGYYDSASPEIVQQILLDIGSLLRESARVP
jgi:protein SCO1/2